LHLALLASAALASSARCKSSAARIAGSITKETAAVAAIARNAMSTAATLRWRVPNATMYVTR